jgi:hypothetical protein
MLHTSWLVTGESALPANSRPEVGMVLKKIKIFNFFERAQKRSNFSENDIDIYLRLFLKYGAKLSSQKKVISVQS